MAEVGFRLGRVWGLRDDCHLVNAVGARWWEAEVKLSWITAGVAIIFSIESAVCCRQANPANAIAITHHAVSCQLRHTHVDKYKRSQLHAFTILAHTHWCVMRAQLLASRGRCFKSSSANIARLLRRFCVGVVVAQNALALRKALLKQLQRAVVFALAFE